MIEEEHHGGCLCGNVRYTVIGHPKPTGVCHCRYCQLRTGSAFGVLAYFEPDKFRLDAGELTHYNFKSESDKNWDTYFCPTCGTTVYYNLESWGSLVGIDASTFDPPTLNRLHNRRLKRVLKSCERIGGQCIPVNFGDSNA